MEPDFYNSIASISEGYFRDRGSKFYAFAFPVETEDEVKDKLTLLKKEHFNANHHIYAFRLGAGTEHVRSSDDGEPANSSGKPVLGQILSHQLSDILVVVVRYFGGVKLGVPGLINAYRTAAGEALKSATPVQKTITRPLSVSFDYKLMSQVMRIVDEENIAVASRDFSSQCNLALNLRKSRYETIVERFRQIYGVTIIES